MVFSMNYMIIIIFKKQHDNILGNEHQEKQPRPFPTEYFNVGQFWSYIKKD